MMCQEVIELMQRYLDQDLDEMEYEQMLGHLQQCADCTELFQRLVALSRELEQLPKVTPAYSLVDAILPKLQRIDEEFPTMEFQPAAVPAAAAPKLREEIPDDRQQSRAAEVAGWRKRMRGLVSVRIVGGVVAAGLVLGFFLFDQQKNSQISSELLSPFAAQNKSANSESKASGSAADMSSQQPMNYGAPSAASDAPSKSVSEEKRAAPKQAMPSSEQSTAGKLAEPDKTDSNAPKDQLQEGGAAQPEPLKQETAQDGKQPPVASLTVPPAGRTGEVPLGNGSDGGTADDSKKQDEAFRSSESSTAAPDADDKRGFGVMDDWREVGNQTGDTQVNGLSRSTDESAPAGNVLASEDNAYVAAVTEQRQVVIRDKQGKDVFVSANKWTEKDRVELVEWKSGTKLTYKVSNGTAVTSYVIDLKEKTEFKEIK